MSSKKRSRGHDIIVVGASAGGLEALDALTGQLPADLDRQVPCNCPNCGGVLSEMDAPKTERHRCHTGHSFTASALLASQSEKIEEMLWISLRMFEERKNLLKSMEKTVRRSLKGANRQRLGETQGYIDRLRGMLVMPGSQGTDDTFTRVKGLMAEPARAKSTR